MKITFCGANREVTGSCYYIETGEAKLLLDCGIFQGGKYAEDKNHLPFPFDPSTLDCVILTHAHLDHCGRLPKLYKEGFRGRIFCTGPTAELAMITLRDAAHLIGEEAERHEHEPLYSLEDVEPLDGMWQATPYHQEVRVASNVSAYMVDAGHILGSASVKIMADGQAVVFSGDLGNTSVPLLNGSECLTGADLVVIESTYGNRVHEGEDQREHFLRDAILDTVRTKGVLLVPAFALERSQELLYELNRLHADKEIPADLPIFLDSPMAISATEVFRRNVSYFDAEAKHDLLRYGDLFSFPGLRYTRSSDESKAILDVRTPKVIIAGSGMMNGGRILHHLKNYLSLPHTILVIIGFQVDGSLGRQLHQGEKLVSIFGSHVNVKADVRSCGAFSGHADYPRLMHWLHCFAAHPPTSIYVTHGEINAATSFSRTVEEQLGIPSAVPEYGSTVDIGQLKAAAAI